MEKIVKETFENVLSVCNRLFLVRKKNKVICWHKKMDANEDNHFKLINSVSERKKVFFLL